MNTSPIPALESRSPPARGLARLCLFAALAVSALLLLPAAQAQGKPVSASRCRRASG
jgi:hypothetical protein